MSNPDLAVDTLKALRYGQAEHELCEAIAEAVQAARDTGKQLAMTVNNLGMMPQNGKNPVLLVVLNSILKILMLHHRQAMSHG